MNIDHYQASLSELASRSTIKTQPLEGALKKMLSLTEHFALEDWNGLSSKDITAQVLYDMDATSLEEMWHTKSKQDVDRHRAVYRSPEDINKPMHHNYPTAKTVFQEKSSMDLRKEYAKNAEQLLVMFARHHIVWDATSPASDWCVNDAVNKFNGHSDWHNKSILFMWLKELNTKSDELLVSKVSPVADALAAKQSNNKVKQKFSGIFVDAPSLNIWDNVFNYAIKHSLTDRLEYLHHKKITPSSDVFGQLISERKKKDGTMQETSSDVLCVLLKCFPSMGGLCPTVFLRVTPFGETKYIDVVLSRNIEQEFLDLKSEILSKGDIDVYAHLVQKSEPEQKIQLIVDLLSVRGKPHDLQTEQSLGRLMEILNKEEKKEVFRQSFRKFSHANLLAPFLDPEDVEDITVECILKDLHKTQPHLGAAFERRLMKNVLPQSSQSTPKKKM